VLSGGNTLFAGFGKRLSKEIRLLTPKLLARHVKVVDIPKRKYSVWTGGSILSSNFVF